MKTVDEARRDVIVQVGYYAAMAEMHSESGKDEVSIKLTAALDQLEQSIRHDELAKFRAIAERTGEAEGVGNA